MSRPIPGVDINLIDNTTLHQAALLIKQSLLHVDGESGLVHLAKALHTKCVVIFGPTNVDYFGHQRNENICSEVCSNCWWITHDWLDKCPRGLVEPECMRSVTPERVHSVVTRSLGNNPDEDYSVVAAEMYSGERIIKLHDSGRVPSTILDSRLDPDGSLLQQEESEIDPLGGEAWKSRFLHQALVRRFGEERFDAKILYLGRDSESESEDFSTAEYNGEESHGRFIGLNDHSSINLECSLGDCDWHYNIPAENGAYDAVVCFSDWAESRTSALKLKEACRVLNQRGILILAVEVTAGHEQSNRERSKRCRCVACVREILGLLSVSRLDPLRLIRQVRTWPSVKHKF